MTPRRQEFRQCTTASRIIGGHGGEARIILAAVEQDDGYALLGAALRQGGGHRHRRHDDAVHPVIEDFRQDAFDVGAGLCGDEDQDVVSLRL